MVVVGAIPGLQSGGVAERGMAETRQRRQLGTRQRRQTIQDKQDNLKQDKDELELGLWMLQLHAEGDGNSVRAGGCDICSVVGYYAMLCKVYSKIKMCEYEFHDGKRCMGEALPNSKYCILHVDLPEDEESDEFKRINQHRDFIKAWQASKRYSELLCGLHSLQHSHGNI